MDAETLLRHAGFVRAIARGLLAADDAEDVVQDTMVAALERPPRDPSRLKAWLGAVGRRLSLRRRRSDWRRDARERRGARPEALPSAAEVAGQLEIQRKVVEAVLALDEPYRSTVVHRFFHDRPVEEIARGLGVPKKTVESRLTRALSQLRARLDREHGSRRAWTVALLPLAWPRPGGAVIGGLVMSAKAKVLTAAAVLAVLGLGVGGLEAVRQGEGDAAARAEARRARDVPADTAGATVAAEATGAPALPAEPAVAAERLPPLPPPPPGTLTGRITCADGKPAKGARVVALGNLERDGVVVSGPGETTEEIEARTDEQGVYRFERLKTGCYQIQAFHDGHAPSPRWSSGHYVSATCGARLSLQLKLGGTLEVLVRDVAGKGLPDLEVDLLEGIVIHEGQEPIARAVTDEQGVATFEHLSHGETIRVRAQGEEQLRTCLMLYDRHTTFVEVVVGSVVAGDVALEGGGPVRGGRVVCFGPMDGKQAATRAEAPLDASGRYALRWLVPGAYEVSVIGVGVGSGYRRVEVPAEPAVTLPLRLGLSVVSGRVIRDASAGGTGVVVVKDGVVQPREIYARLDSGKGQLITAYVASDGNFAFYDVRPGKYTLSAWENGGLDARCDITVVRDERIEGKDLVLSRRSGEIEIEVVDAGGAFTGHVQLYLDSTSIAPPALGPGRYRFPARVGPRAVTVQWANGSRSTKVDFDVEDGKTAYKTVRLGE